MQSLTTIKDKSQASWNRIVEAGKQQPAERKVWGVTIGAAVVGGVALAAVAKGVLAIVGTLASTPVALTVGAAAGGAAGWSLMQNQSAEARAGSITPSTDSVVAATSA